MWTTCSGMIKKSLHCMLCSTYISQTEKQNYFDSQEKSPPNVNASRSEALAAGLVLLPDFKVIQCVTKVF